MSIPPLVCSTPPPPDQCEDDKDPEDFDLQYNRKFTIHLLINLQYITIPCL